MADIKQSEYKDTSVAKRFIKKYHNLAMLTNIGIFLIIISFIPLMLITGENLNEKIIPTIIIAIVGIILAFVGQNRLNSHKEKNRNKYTVSAYEVIEGERRESEKFFRRDTIIGVLLIILSPILYFFIHQNASFIPANMSKYLTAILLFILGLGVLLILNSKSKKSAYKFFKENI